MLLLFLDVGEGSLQRRRRHCAGLGIVLPLLTEDISAVGFIADAIAGISGSVGSNGRGARHHHHHRWGRRSRSSGGSGDRKRRRCQPMLTLDAAEARHRTFVAQVAAAVGGETHTDCVRSVPSRQWATLGSCCKSSRAQDGLSLRFQIALISQLGPTSLRSDQT